MTELEKLEQASDLVWSALQMLTEARALAGAGEAMPLVVGTEIVTFGRWIERKVAVAKETGG